MSLDPIQLDHRRLRDQYERRINAWVEKHKDTRERIIAWGIVAIMLGMSALAGLGLAVVLYYVNHP